MNSSLIKQYCVKLTSFKMIGWLIIIMGTLYFVNNFSPNGDISNAISYFILIIIIGLFFLYFGSKKRCLQIFEDRIIYKEATEKFNEKIEDIILLKSFQELNKNTTNLIIMTENNTLNISSAFFKEEYLKDAFIIIKNMNLENIKIEDDLDWSTN